MRTKKLKFLAIILGFIMAIMPLTTTGCSLFGPNENDIEIVNQGFGTNAVGYPCIVVYAKNKSSNTINVGFFATVYYYGTVVDTANSGTTRIGAGETARLSASLLINSYSTVGYTFKITKWQFYNV